MTTIIGLCGSLRRGSYNRMLLRAAVEAAPSGTSIEPESIREIPLYDGDVEEEQGLRPWFERGVLISDAFTVFDTDGRIADAAMRQRIRKFIEGFAAFAALQQPQVDRRAPAALNPQVDLRLPDFMASSHRERGAMSIVTKEGR